MKILIISGSPRKGNTEYILTQLYHAMASEAELVLLRNKNIGRCRGCLYCDEHKECAICDDMQELYGKMLAAHLIVLGTPNYFDNVSGLAKDFIDRTNPFYETDKLKGKKLITVVMGGGKIENSRRVGEQALRYFSDSHQLNLVSAYYFQGLHGSDIEKDANSAKVIESIADKIRSEMG